MLNRLQHSKSLTIMGIMGYALIPLCIIGYSIYVNTGTKRPSPFASWPLIGESLTANTDSEPTSSDVYSDTVAADVPVVDQSPQIVTANQPSPKPQNTKRPIAQSNQVSSQHTVQPQEKPKQEPIPTTPPTPAPEPVDNTPPVEPTPEPDPAPEPEPTPPIIPIDPPIIDPPAIST